MRRAIRSTTIVLGALLVSWGNAAAQETRQQRVDQLHAQALELQQDQSKLVPAAHLYVREAELRGDADPQAVKCLTAAAHLLYYGKRVAEARRVMEQAADMALARGDVAVAAHTYLQAAWLAQAGGVGADSRRLAHQAEMLAGSPLLATAERDAIRARLNQITTISLR